jgi:hypothetical protein
LICSGFWLCTKESGAIREIAPDKINVVKPLEILKYPDQPRQSSNSGDFIKLRQSGAFEILRHEKIYMAQL